MSYRETKRQARQALHDHMKVAAVYIAPSSSPLPVNVRLHMSFMQNGNMTTGNLNYSEQQDTKPSIIFLKSEVPSPQRLAVVSIATGEAYRIDNVLPADDITIRAEVIKLPVSQTIGLPVPAAE